MKICFLFSNSHLADLTAEPKMALRLAWEVSKNGHHVHIISNSTKNIQKIERNINFLLFRGLGNLKTYLTNTHKIVWYLNKIKPDILHVHGGVILVYAWCINMCLKIPLAFTLCESLDTFSGLQKKLLLFCLSRMSSIFVISSYYKNQLMLNGIQEKRIVVARLGLEDSFLVARRFKETNTDIFFFGDSSEERGFDIVYSLAKEMKDLFFTILIRWEKDCIHDLSELKKMPNVAVYYSPYKEPLINMICKSKIVLLPFRRMGVRPPLSIVEVMALEKCVVTSTMTGNEEIIENNKNGILSDFKKLDEVKSKIEHLMTHPDELERLGINAKKTIQTMYSRGEVRKIIQYYALTKS